MSERNITSPDQLIPVDIHTFRSGTRDITFDVYLKLSSTNVAHIFSKTTGLDYKRLAQYIQKGVKELYIHPDDKAAYQEFIARPAEGIFLDPKTSTEKKIAALLNMTEQNMAEIFTQFEIEPETAANTKRVVDKYVELMVSSPETLTIILKLISHGEYLYYHSIAVSIFSMFIAKASGQFNQRMYEIVGMGGFLHDIGCSQLSRDIMNSPEDLTSDQWAEMRTHPTLGMKMLENTKIIPDEVRYIVYQHHEEPSGKGYPNQLHGNAIYYPSKIVSLADAFSALISKRPYRPAYSVEAAIQIIQDSTGKFDKELVKIISSIFLSRTMSKKAG